MLAGLKFKGEGVTAVKKSKKEKEKEKKQERRKEKKKKAKEKGKKKANKSDSSSSGNASLPEPDKNEAQSEIPSQPAVKTAAESVPRENWMASANADADFFSSLGSSKTTKNAKLAIDPEKPVVSEREWVRNAASVPAPVSVGVVPKHLTVGDGGAKWRQRAAQRAKQSARDEGDKVPAADVPRINRSDNGSRSGTEQPAQLCDTDRRKSRSRSQRTRHRSRSRSQGSRRRSRSRKRSNSRKRSSRGAASEDLLGIRERGDGAGSDGRVARSGNAWLKDSGKNADTGEAEADAVLKQMQSKYGGGSGQTEKHSSNAAPVEAHEVPEDANALGAMAMEAMLAGDMDRYEELNRKLEQKQAALIVAGSADQQQRMQRGPGGETIKILEEVDAQGRSRSLLESVHGTSVAVKGRKGKKGTANMARDAKGQKDGGFYDDDDVSFEELYRREKIEGVQDYDGNLAQHIMKNGKFKQVHEDDDEAYALGWYEGAAKKADAKKLAAKQESQQRGEKQRIQQNLQHCIRCAESRKFAQKAVLSMSPRAQLFADSFERCIVPDQVVICPLEHLPTTNDVDDAVWTEIRNYQKSLVRLFEAEEPPRAVLFAETAIHTVSRDKLLMGAGPHAAVVAYPIEMGLLVEARAYFKKALDESECEWVAQHKRVIDTDAKGGVRAKVPKHFPYVHVDFCLGGGYAHVVEEAGEFPREFMQQTIAGMCELTVLDRAYASREEHSAAVEKLRSRLADGMDWTLALKS